MVKMWLSLIVGITLCLLGVAALMNPTMGIAVLFPPYISFIVSGACFLNAFICASESERERLAVESQVNINSGYEVYDKHFVGRDVRCHLRRLDLGMEAIAHSFINYPPIGFTEEKYKRQTFLVPKGKELLIESDSPIGVVEKRFPVHIVA